MKASLVDFCINNAHIWRNSSTRNAFTVCWYLVGFEMNTSYKNKRMMNNACYYTRIFHLLFQFYGSTWWRAGLYTKEMYSFSISMWRFVFFLWSRIINIISSIALIIIIYTYINIKFFIKKTHAKIIYWNCIYLYIY